jgi:alanine-glyoxylate transaminase / serine-glyoxylate transaminase / serine-pyruvate transaminase
MPITRELSSLTPVLLMGPGPSSMAPEVYQALGTPLIGHLDPRFISLMDSLKTDLQQLMRTQNRLTIPISGTGSAGMETCFVNLVEKGDPVLICINGVFGLRMQDVASRLGAEVDTLEFEWGTPIDPVAVAQALEKKKYLMVALIQAETSTGVRNPIDQIGEMCRESGALYLVDTVTSLGGIEVSMDAWHIDALYSGTQKCLSCPPGLSPVSFSEHALEKLNSRKSKVPNWYLDLTLITKYWEGANRVYHHTAPVSMIYALHQAVRLILAEGLEQVFARHLEVHQYLVEGLRSLGLDMLVVPEFRLPMLNAVKIPEGLDEASVRSRLLAEEDIEIGAGLGPLAGKIWRIGLMGHTARKPNVDRLIGALSKLL